MLSFLAPILDIINQGHVAVIFYLTVIVFIALAPFMSISGARYLKKERPLKYTGPVSGTFLGVVVGWALGFGSAFLTIFLAAALKSLTVAIPALISGIIIWVLYVALKKQTPLFSLYFTITTIVTLLITTYFLSVLMALT